MKTEIKKNIKNARIDSSLMEDGAEKPKKLHMQFIKKTLIGYKVKYAKISIFPVYEKWGVPD